MVDEGHIVGNHSMVHNNIGKISGDQKEERIREIVREEIAAIKQHS